MSEQLAFTLPAKVALGREDYFVSSANALAVETIEDWVNWPLGKLVLCGPNGSGKTHLAMVWSAETDAKSLPATDIADPESLAQSPLVVEDINLIAGDRAAETELFHLHNLMAERRHALLMTSTDAPARLSLSLPDLRSRLEAASIATLEAPDDMLLMALVLKMFSDRQISVKPDVLNYALPRLPRSFVAVRNFVTQMDQRALAERRALNRSLAKEVLAALESG